MAQREHRTRIILIMLFGVAMAYVEAMVVVYLRELFYPEGFSFPLKLVPLNLITMELFRELASVVMVVAVAAIAGKKFWERFGYFIVLFGIWDIFYYIWLKVTIDWPFSLLDWDILFLIPIPWIGPVIAPVLVALLMVVIGLSITSLFARGYTFRPTALTWVLSVVGTTALLFSFMRDTGATLYQQMPQPYWYGFLIVGLLLNLIAYLHSYRRRITASIS
jgi:hypothetical protein